MTRTWLALLSLGSGAGFWASEAPVTASQRQVEGRAVFVDVAVVPLDRDTVLAHQDVHIADGRIVRIEPTGSAVVPTSARRIDGRGKYLAPGLADMHVHVRDERELPLFVAYGVTTIRNMGGGPHLLEWRRQIEAGTRLGPTMYTGGLAVQSMARLVGLAPPLITIEEDVLVQTSEHARRVVADQRSAGYDFIKLMWATRDVYGALMDAAREARIPVVGHVPLGGIEAALAARQRSVEHLNGYESVLVPADAPIRPGRGLRSRLLSWNYADTTRFARWAEATASAGTWNCPTLITPQVRWLPEEQYQRLLVRPEMRYRSPVALEAIRDRSRDSLHFSGVQPGDHEAVQASIAVRKRFVRALHRAGAGLLAGTDASNGMPVVQGASLRAELENFVSAGLTPFEALRTATVNPAEFLDGGGWGSIAVGNRADLILLDANPIENIRNLEQLSGVMVRGRWLSRAALDELLQGLEAEYQRD